MTTEETTTLESRLYDLLTNHRKWSQNCEDHAMDEEAFVALTQNMAFLIRLINATVNPQHISVACPVDIPGPQFGTQESKVAVIYDYVRTHVIASATVMHGGDWIGKLDKAVNEKVRAEFEKLQV